MEIIDEIIEKNKVDIQHFKKEMQYEIDNNNLSESLRYSSIIVSRELAISDLELIKESILENKPD